jgi:hypothetical protein
MAALTHDMNQRRACIMKRNTAGMLLAIQVKIPAVLIQASSSQHFAVELVKIVFANLLCPRFTKSGKDKVMAGKLLDSEKVQFSAN